MDIAKIGLSAFLAATLSGCGHMPATALHLQLDAAKTINPDLQMQALPVRVKIYQLRDATAFREASFNQLWKHEDAVLGASLLAKRELTINPGQQLTLKLAKAEDAEYIGIVGVFRDHGDNGWKAVKPMPGMVGSMLGKVFVSIHDRDVEVRS